jgi:hypothetical protein
MTADNSENPASTLAAAAAPAATSKPRDPLDPLGWEVLVVCKDCNKGFKVPYRHFHAGVVFHCPHCHGSYVPTLSMYRQVHDIYETFYARMRRERDETTAVGGDESAFTRRFEDALAQFIKTVEQLARMMRPAGKLVRRKGLAAMFT